MGNVDQGGECGPLSIISHKNVRNAFFLDRIYRLKLYIVEFISTSVKIKRNYAFFKKKNCIFFSENEILKNYTKSVRTYFSEKYWTLSIFENSNWFKIAWSRKSIFQNEFLMYSLKKKWMVHFPHKKVVHIPQMRQARRYCVISIPIDIFGRRV